MTYMTLCGRVLGTAFLLLLLSSSAMAQLTEVFEPLPSEAAVLVINSHPDDESIFFGGVLSYYSRVKDLPTVMISMNSGITPQTPFPIREDELRNAAKQHGVRYEPIFARFADCCFSVDRHGQAQRDASLRAWSDDDTIAGGIEKAGNFLATQIRQLKPAVVVGHDLYGEYGHGNHQASGFVTAEAFTRAADPNLILTDDLGAPLAPWQADKLYLHLSDTNPMFHTGWNTPEAALGGKTAIEIANLAVAEHVSQDGGTRFVVETYNDPGPQVSESDRDDNNPFSSWADLYSEAWGLYDRAPDFPLDSTSDGVLGPGHHYGDFLENVDLSRFDIPDVFNLTNGASFNDYLVLNGNMFTNHFDLTPAESLAFGDMNGDLEIDQHDFFLFKDLYQMENPGAAVASLSLPRPVPEPSSLVLLAIMASAWSSVHVRRLLVH